MEKRETITYLIFVLILFFMSFVSASSVGLIENSIWQSNLTGVRFPSISLGDIDDDGNDDMALIGCLTDGGDDCENGVIAKIYVNNGTTLTESLVWQQNLTGVGFGSIAFGDIDNDGDLDLGLIGCTNSSSLTCTNGERVAKIYVNNGTTLTESLVWQQNLTGTFNGALTWGDVDRDGKLDLALVGQTASSYIAKIYINNGTSLVESNQWQNNLTGIFQGEIAFWDIDNDGDLDLGLTGDTGSSKITKIYINNGTSLVQNTTWSQNLLGVDRSSLVFGDIDNDGDLDLDLIGQIAGDHQRVYLNNGTTFTENQAQGGTFEGLFRGCIAFGDYDNDGDLDLAAMGKEAGRAKIYENNYTNLTHNNFIVDTTAHANISDEIIQCSLTFGDVDNDNNIDLMVSGLDVTLLISKVYISNASLTKNNTQPLAPTSGFSSSYANNVLTLSWGNGSDTETNTSGLYYNLRVGNVTNNNSIVSGVYGGSSNPTAGYFGNMMQRKSISLNVQLEANKTYYWQVQTIDTGLAKSNWSVTQSFNTSLDTTKPSITINYPSPNESLHTTNPYFIFNATVIDANLTNVTLYANFNGTMLTNETNSSGLNGTYIFEKNLTNINDGMYSWYIGANDTSNNSQSSETRNFYLDRAYPLVYLVSPANSAIWTSSSTVTFSYNVSDVDIANCSLVVNNVIVNTSLSVSEDTQQNFTYSLSNGNYAWKINCSDYVGFTNSSETRSLTVSYTAPSSGSSGGGGGGIAVTTKTYTLTNEQLLQGYTQILSKNDKIKFSINNINHSLIVNSVNETLSYANLTLNSTPLNFLIYINETRKFELTNDNYYDLSVKLNFINNDKANLTIKSIYEKIEVKEEEKKEEEVGEEERKEEKLSEVKKYLFFLVIGIIIIVILITYSRKYIKYKRWKKWTLLG